MKINVVNAIFCVKKYCTADTCNKMDYRSYKTYFTEILPHGAPKSVTVVNNASYYSTEKVQLVAKSWRKNAKVD